MKAYRIREFTGVGALERADLPDPEPGFGEVVVRVHATSLNYRDLMIARGQYNPRLPRPLVPLSDGAGVVEAVGPGVTRFAVGDRVAGCFMPGWQAGPIDDEVFQTALGAGRAGMLAERVALPETGVVRTPDHLSDEEAACLPCAALTAWHALYESTRIQAGDTVLVQGTGGVSLFALQFARAAGARVIATSSRDDKLTRALELGATDGINYRTTPDWDKKAKELTGGRGVDHIIEVGGVGTLPRSVKAVRTGGHIALIGLLSGVGANFDPLPILMRSIRLQGIFVGSRTMFEAMNRALVANPAIRPVIDRVFSFDEAPAAYAHLEGAGHFGKIVVTI